MLIPRSRDFTSGKFKFRSTETGSLPTDDDLIRTTRIGLPGTSMPAWEPFLSADDIAAVVAYLKTFSARFAGESGREVGGAPGATGSADAGKAVYETLKCAACHGTDGAGAGAIAQVMWPAPEQ